MAESHGEEDLSRRFPGFVMGLLCPDDIVDMEDEPAPSYLNPINSSGGFHVVSTDKLSVQYTSTHLHGHDVGVVQANCPAPMKKLVYYFEIFVKNAGQKGQIAIGFTTEHFKMRRQPGWEANSCGYHGDDGLLYQGQGKGESFGPTFTSGDTIGGGINYATQEFFFIKNGKLVGTVCKDMKCPLFPTVAVHSQNEEVQVNFGQEPFVFDIQAFVLEERQKQQAMIEKEALPLSLGHMIVRSYLLYYGYQETLDSFDVASKTTLHSVPIKQSDGAKEQLEAYALEKRRILRQCIRSGDIDSAFGKLGQWYPQLVQVNVASKRDSCALLQPPLALLEEKTTICFLLHCQKFIELIRVEELEAAVHYARAKLARFFGDMHLASLLQDCMALLAYEEPRASPVGRLLDVAQREAAADAVNIMILSTNPELKDSRKCLRSHLEQLIRQLTACCLEKRALSGEQGETFQLCRALNSNNRDILQL